VIPRSAVAVTQEVDLDRIRAPGPSDVEYPGWAGIIHEHSPWIWHEATWGLAAEALTAEDALMRSVDMRAATAGEWDDLSFDESFEWPGDFGLHGLLCALNAAGYVTASSCSGHQEGQPHVLLACDRQRAVMLVDMARGAGCGIENFRTGLQVWAPSVAEMIALARSIVATREAFDELPVPAPRLDPRRLDEDGRGPAI
jgi:hypothetical protein